MSIPLTPPETRTANRQIARAAGTVMMAFVISNIVGLVRTILVGRAFGTSADLDAFNAANRVAELLFNLVAGGALGSAFIPTFTGFLTKDDHEGAWKLASSVANILLLILIAISILGVVFAPQIVRNGLYILAPDQSPVQEELTIHLLRVLMPSVVIFGISGLVMGILNARQIFLVPAIAPAMYSLGIILGATFLAPRMGIDGMAWGAVLGAGLHLVVQVPTLLRQKGKYFLSLGLHLPAVREVARLMAPRLFGVAIVQLNFIANTVIALSLPVGSVSSITYAFTLMMMPQAAIAQSLAIAAMPTFSAQYARGKLDEMRGSLAASLRGVLLLSVPASIGLMFLRKPIIALLYQRGEFTAQSTNLVAWALLWYAAGLVSHSVVEIVSRAFYALHDTRTPVIVGVVVMSLNVALSLIFASLFGNLGLPPHGGLALANTTATTLEMAALLFLMRRRLKGLQGREILDGFVKALAAAAAMTAALVFWNIRTGLAPSWLAALGGILIGGSIYAGLIFVLRVKEAGQLWSAVRRRLPF